MRVNLISKLSGRPTSSFGTLPLSLTIKSFCGLPRDYQYATDSTALVRLLHKRTDLPGSVIERFESELLTMSTAKILSVDLSERVLTVTGYFVD